MTSWAGCPNNFQGQSFPVLSIFSSLWSCYISFDGTETCPNYPAKCPSTIINDKPWMDTGTAVMFIKQNEEREDIFSHLVLTGWLLAFYPKLCAATSGWKGQVYFSRLTCFHSQRGCLRTNCSSGPSQLHTFSKLLQRLFGSLAKFSPECARAEPETGEGWNRISPCSSGWTYTCSNPPACTSWGWSQVSSTPKIKSTINIINSHMWPFGVKLLGMSLNTLACLWYYPPWRWALYQVIILMDVMYRGRHKPRKKLFPDESFRK